MSAVNGTYRINSTLFPAPITSWEEQSIASGLNGIPILSSYRIHRWELGELDGSFAEVLFSLFDSQQSGNAQLTTLETDPYDASRWDERYGTTEYTDFVIQSLSPRTRGLPFYRDLAVTFEVYVS